MDRKTISDMAFYAYTLEECAAAEQAIIQWLRRHPEDGAYLSEVCSQLAIVKLGAQEERTAQEARHQTAA